VSPQQPKLPLSHSLEDTAYGPKEEVEVDLSTSLTTKREENIQIKAKEKQNTTPSIRIPSSSDHGVQGECLLGKIS